ncbi:hypothetical protein BsWGS_05399 [Bradybaena similaris]
MLLGSHSSIVISVLACQDAGPGSAPSRGGIFSSDSDFLFSLNTDQATKQDSEVVNISQQSVSHYEVYLLYAANPIFSHSVSHSVSHSEMYLLHGVSPIFSHSDEYLLYAANPIFSHSEMYLLYAANPIFSHSVSHSEVYFLYGASPIFSH